MKMQLSIHPRNWPWETFVVLKWTERRKKNTAGVADPDRVARVIAGIKKHLAAHPRDEGSRARLAKLGG